MDGESFADPMWARFGLLVTNVLPAIAGGTAFPFEVDIPASGGDATGGVVASSSSSMMGGQ